MMIHTLLNRRIFITWSPEKTIDIASRAIDGGSRFGRTQALPVAAEPVRFHRAPAFDGTVPRYMLHGETSMTTFRGNIDASAPARRQQNRKLQADIYQNYFSRYAGKCREIRKGLGNDVAFRACYRSFFTLIVEHTTETRRLSSMQNQHRDRDHASMKAINALFKVRPFLPMLRMLGLKAIREHPGHQNSGLKLRAFLNALSIGILQLGPRPHGASELAPPDRRFHSGNNSPLQHNAKQHRSRVIT